MTKVFIVKEWGFLPSEWPVIGFPSEERCQSLINRAKGEPDALVAVIGTLYPPTHESEQGCLLGVATFERNIIPTEDLISEYQRTLKQHYIDEENKELRWPFGVEMKEAHRFPSKPPARGVIKRSLDGQIASGQAVLLKDKDTKAVLDLLAREGVKVYP